MRRAFFSLTSPSSPLQVLNGEDPGKKLLTKKDQQQYMDAEEEFAVSCVCCCVSVCGFGGGC